MLPISAGPACGIADQFVRLQDATSLTDYQQLLNRLFPNRVAEITAIITEIRRVMGYMDVLYGIDNPPGHTGQMITRAIQTGLPAIWQAGQWTFSPSGLPVSVLTGKLAADAIIKALKRR